MFGYIMLFTAIAVVAAIIFDAMGDEKHFGSSVIVAGIIGLLINWLVFYTGMPYLTHWLSWMGLIVLNVGIGVVSALILNSSNSVGTGFGVVVIVALLAVWGFGAMGTPPAAICGDAGYDRMANYLNIQTSVDSYPETDLTSVIRIPESVALARAGIVLSQGENAVLGNYLAPNRAYLQYVQGRPMYVVDLKVTDNVSYNNNGGVIPAFVLVDAMDKSVDPILVSGLSMKYSPGAWFGKDLFRRVYSDYMLGTPYRILDLDGMEVSDDVVPQAFYVGSLATHTIGIEGTSVNNLLIFNPQTGFGETKTLADKPEWIDRVYPLDWVGNYVDYWAGYSNHTRCPYEGTKGMMMVDNRDDVTIPGGIEYQFTITSVGNDPSIIGLVTVNPETLEAKRYPMSGKTIETIKLAMTQRANENINQTTSYTAEMCEYHRILDADTIYCILTYTDQYGDKNIGGYGFVNLAQTNENDQSVYAVAQTFEEAYSSYELIRSNLTTAAAIDNTQNDIQIEGVVLDNVRVDKPSVEQPSFLITVQSRDGTVYYLLAPSSSLNAAIAQPGKEIVATAYQLPNQSYYTVRNLEIKGAPDLGSALYWSELFESWTEK